LLASIAAICWADPPIEAIVRGKQATAFVTVEVADGMDEGSAFCIDPSGLFVTNAHVVEDQKPGGRIKLVLHSGEKDQVEMPANVVKLNKGKDLATLQAVHPKNLTALQLGSAEGLIETMSVVAFGYPFGSILALKDGDYPSITVSTGHITALRKVDDELNAIQLDASLNEGNSGGPIIDSKGEVVAIVMAGIPGSGINLAIPVSFLRSVVNALSILFTPPVAKAGHLHDDQDFRIELLTQPGASKERAVVEITLSSKETGKRTIKTQTIDGRTYTAQAPLLGDRPTKIPDAVNFQITATRAGKVIASEDGEISLENALPAPASLAMLYDGFAYPVGGAVEAQNGGKGNWGNAWVERGQGSTASVISGGGLTFANLKTSGNAILTTSDLPVGEYRQFRSSPGKIGPVLFISYLVKPINVNHNNAYFELVYGGVSIGGGHGCYSLNRSGGGSLVETHVPVVPGQTAFLVVRITFGADNSNDIVDLFVNPAPGRPLPVTPDATKSDQNTGRPNEFNFGCNIRCVFDEVRFGRTFAEVAPTR
jgi:S1-C subfamily serine protease